MENRAFIAQYVMNNITYWEGKDTKYTANPEQIFNQMRRRSRTGYAPHANEIAATLEKLRDDQVITSAFNGERYHQYGRGKNFAAFAAFLEDVHGAKIKNV